MTESTSNGLTSRAESWNEIDNNWKKYDDVFHNSEGISTRNVPAIQKILRTRSFYYMFGFFFNFTRAY